MKFLSAQRFAAELRRNDSRLSNVVFMGEQLPQSMPISVLNCPCVRGRNGRTLGQLRQRAGGGAAYSVRFGHRLQAHHRLHGGSRAADHPFGRREVAGGLPHITCSYSVLTYLTPLPCICGSLDRSGSVSASDH